MDKITFGQFIKQSRNKKEMTQKQLADLLFIDVTAVSKWERGITYPDITLIPEICKHLEINEHELISCSNDTEYRNMKSEAEKYKKLKNILFCSFSRCYMLYRKLMCQSQFELVFYCFYKLFMRVLFCSGHYKIFSKI